MSEREIHQNYERHNGNWHEWSTDTTCRKDTGAIVEGNKPQRLFVRVGEDLGLIELIEAQVTSDKPEGRELSGKRKMILLLTGDMADWLIDVLTKARKAQSEPEIEK